MARIVSIRSINRSAKIRVRNTSGSLVRLRVDVDTQIDLDSLENQHALGHHSAVGQYNVLPEFTTTVAAPTGVSALDTPAIQSALTTAAAAGGGIVELRPGTYVINATLSLDTGVLLRGSGRSVTYIKADTNLNAPLVKTVNFDALTKTGNNTSGAAAFEIGDLTLDGNAVNQSTATSAGVLIYGYDFLLRRIAIRSVRAASALYTEWGTSGSAGLIERAMEAVVTDVRIHDNILTSAGWHYRGPHDAMTDKVIIYQNTTNAFGFWAESQGTVMTIASGSNAVDVATFLGAGVVNVNTTVGYPTTGSFVVGGATIVYTGKTATTFTGCTTTAGSGTLSTGQSVSPVNGGYAGSAALIDQMHIWGSHSWAMVLDAGAKISNTEIEGATVGQLLVRGGDASLSGGRIFYLPGSSNPGCGIQVGDTNTQGSGFLLNDVDMTGFAGGSAAQSALNFVSTASGQYRARIFNSTGAQQVYGSIQPYEKREITYAGSTTPTVASGGALGTTPPTSTLSNASDHRGSIRMGSGTSPTTGTAATVTWKQPKPGTPTVIVAPGNAATAPLQPYVFNMSSTGFSIGFAVAPAASQAAATYEVFYTVDG